MSSALGHYTILHSIGRGAMGEVFLAEVTIAPDRTKLYFNPFNSEADIWTVHRPD